LCLCAIGKLECGENHQFIYSFTLCLTVFIFYELLAQKVYLDNFELDRFIRFGLVALIFIALSLRGLQLTGIYSERSRNEVQNKLNALQARIEPHFLFNSL